MAKLKKVKGGSKMAKGLLIASFDFSNAYEDEFHDWYDLEHIPERKAVPGFPWALRCRARQYSL